MTETGSYFRIFFDKPPSADPMGILQEALTKIPGAGKVDIALPYRTARFHSDEVDSKQVIQILEAEGITVVSVHRSQ